MRKSAVLLIAITLSAAAFSPFGAIQPESPTTPETQDAEGHEINELYIDFVDNVIDDARWPGADGPELLYVGHFGFGVVDNFISSNYFDYPETWELETQFYFDWNWPTEVPWGDPPPRYGDENILTYMTDADCTVPLGVRLRQHSFGFADWPDEDFIFILWTVYNAEGGYLEDTAAGLYMDIDIRGGDYIEFTRYDSAHQFAYMYDGLSDFSLPYFGAATMGNEPTGSYHGWMQRDDFDWRPDEFFYTMLSQVGRFQELPEFFYDWRILLGFQLYDLAPGETQDYAVVLVAGWDYEEIVENLAAARAKWEEIFGGGSPEPSSPPRVTLSAPWPCPARDSASFEVALAEPGNVEVVLYDVSGRRVDTVYDGYMTAGRCELSVRTGALPPGVYLIQAAGEGGAAVRRLVVAR